MKTTTDIDIDAVATGYITAALWADATCTCPEPCDCESGGREHLNITGQDRSYIERIVALFVELHRADCETYLEALDDHPEYTAPERLGHDFRLSSGGHGCGLWDRGLGDVGERLHDAAQAGPFSRVDGGDVWQVDDETAAFDHRPLEG